MLLLRLIPLRLLLLYLIPLLLLLLLRLGLRLVHVLLSSLCLHAIWLLTRELLLLHLLLLLRLAHPLGLPLQPLPLRLPLDPGRRVGLELLVRLRRHPDGVLPGAHQVRHQVVVYPERLVGIAALRRRGRAEGGRTEVGVLRVVQALLGAAGAEEDLVQPLHRYRGHLPVLGLGKLVA